MFTTRSCLFLLLLVLSPAASPFVESSPVASTTNDVIKPTLPLNTTKPAPTADGFKANKPTRSSTVSATIPTSTPQPQQPSSQPAPKPTTTKQTTSPKPKPTSTTTKNTPKPPAPTAAPAPIPAPPAQIPSNSSTSAADIAAYLKGHNDERSQRGASALGWSDALAAKAQQWANNCDFKHSGGTLGPFGENLAAGTGGFSIEAGIIAWNDERPDYNPSAPQASHWTQVVWKSSTQVGCAVQKCTGIFGAQQANFYVCEYSPAGNFIGRFPENVQK